MNDLRLAFRLLAKSPGFTLVAVLTLGLGIGMSTSSFSMANAFLLRDVPYPEPHRLMRVFRTTPQSPTRAHAPANALAVRESANSFSTLALYHHESFALGEAGQPAERVLGLAVTANFLETLHVQPALGRGFTTTDEQPGQPAVAVLTHGTWRQRFGGEESVVGRTVRLNGEWRTIVGVLPESFDALLVWGRVELLVPRTIEAKHRTERGRGWLQMVGRLAPNVSLQQAQAELATIAARLNAEFPRENGSDGLRAVVLRVSGMDDVSRGLLWLMTGLSVAMLLIGCANLAGLQVARALGRSREHAIRAALGGTRVQLMKPLLVESVLLALAGGAGGLLLALWSNDIVGSLMIIDNVEGFAFPIDGRVLAFTAVASLTSALAFGLMPAWFAGRAPAAEALKDGARSATAGPAQHRLKRCLIVAELAVALALVGVASSFGVGARGFLQRDVGWAVDALFAGSIDLSSPRYKEDAAVLALQRELLEKVQTLPGVEHAALATSLPIYALGRATRVAVEGQPAPQPGQEPVAEVASITPDFFTTIGVTVKQGMAFSRDVKADDPLIAIVNESMARRLWPDGSAVGRRVRFADSEKWMEIVGVASDVKMPLRIDAPETRFHLYRPLVQAPVRNFTVAVRGAAPESFTAAVRRAVAALDPDLPVAEAGPVRADVKRHLSNVNLVIANLAISGGMGLLIAAVGLFGVIAQLTSQRTRDIGVRMALGAQYRDILQMVLGEAFWLVGVGIVIGLPALVAINTMLGRLLAEMALPGPWLLAANVAVLAATMLAASWVPARRAARVNPIEALRSE